MKHLLLLSCLLFAMCPAAAQDKFQKLDAYLQGLEKSGSFSGIVLVAQQGKYKYSKSAGFADKEQQLKLGPDTQFNLSSTSKLFTATCVLKLVQEGKVKIDDKLDKYFPELTYGSNVTIRHLLTHTSGVPEFYRNEDFCYKNVKNCTDMVPFLAGQELQFTPGDSVLYSASGMMLLGAIIEKVSGLTYRQYVTKHLLKPLKMTNTSFVNYAEATEYKGRQARYAKGYVKNKAGEIVQDELRESDRDFIPLSAGGVWTSAGDLVKFDQGIFTYKILRKQFVDQMTQQYTYTGWPGCYFGYGWIVINSGGNEAAGHAGNSRAFHSTSYHYKQDGTVIIVLTNYGFADVFAVAEQIEKIYYAGSR